MKDDRTIPGYVVDVLILEEMTQIQIKYIRGILAILGRYMLLTTEMLYELYKRNYGEPLRLQFLKKAVHDKLVVEYKYDLGHKSECEIYFYALKTNAGFHALERDNLPYVRIPYLSAYEEKSRIITANQYFIECGYVPDLKFPIPLSKTLKFFYALNSKEQRIVTYLPTLASQAAVERYFAKFDIKEESFDNISFEKITTELIPFGLYTKATHPKDALS